MDKETENNSIYACSLHIEEAIDNFVNCFEMAPQINKTDEKDTKCEYCNNKAIYIITN